MYEDVEAEKKRFGEFEIPVVGLILHVMRRLGIVLVECRIRRGDGEDVSPLIAAAFPHAGKEALKDLTIHKTFHPSLEFMEKLGDRLFYEDIVGNSEKLAEWQNFGIGKLCWAYTDDENWNSKSIFFIVSLSDSEKISELLKIPHIEKGTTKADWKEADNVYQRLFWRTSYYPTELSKAVMPQDISTDILKREIIINGTGRTRVMLSNVEKIVKELACLGFRTIRFKNVWVKSQEEANDRKNIQNKLAFVEFGSGGPIKIELLIDAVNVNRR